MALDWKVGVSGVDGYAGQEIQGTSRSDWFFLASNDQGDMAPQTFKLLVPQSDGVFTLNPWWLGLKDDSRGINCISWNATATVSHGNGLTAAFDATCTTADIHAVGVVSN